MAISMNTDIGEGFGSWRIADDERLLRLVTDANLACGFHAGDPDIMRATCELAASLGVGVGAQVGFNDLRGFGRRFIEVPKTSLVNDIIYQLGATVAFTDLAGIPLSHVKPHGALYHAATQHDAYAEAVVEAITGFDRSLPLLCQPGTRLSGCATSAGVEVVPEGFVDRAYTADGLLVPRGRPGALITDQDVVGERSVRLARDALVEAVDGTLIAMPVRSLCIHSDSPGAAEMAALVVGALDDAGIERAPLRTSP